MKTKKVFKKPSLKLTKRIRESYESYKDYYKADYLLYSIKNKNT